MKLVKWLAEHPDADLILVLLMVAFTCGVLAWWVFESFVWGGVCG